MPYFGEYIIVVLKNMNLLYKIRSNILKRKIEKMTQREKSPEEIEKVQSRLILLQEKHVKIKENSVKREENPYKVKLVKKEAVKWLFLIAILCFVVGLLTPIGNEPYTHLFKLLSGDTTSGISEHQPVVLANHTSAIVVIMIMLILLIFTDTKIRLKDLFMLIGLTILLFMSRRQFSLMLLIGGISIGKLICDFVDKYDTKRNRRIYKTYAKIARENSNSCINCTMFILCIFN